MQLNQLPLKANYRYYIGIDCGVKTGYALWLNETKNLFLVHTVVIHKAMDAVRSCHQTHPGAVFVRVEDARLATFGRQADVHKAQGAGSVKRDAKIWEDFLTDVGVPFEMVRPNKNFTKLSSDQFRRTTGYSGITDSHGRDAAMLVFGF